VQLGAVSLREAHVGQHVGLRLIHQGSERGHLVPELVGDAAPLCRGLLGVAPGKGRSDEGGDDPSAVVTGMRHSVVHEVDSAAWLQAARQHSEAAVKNLQTAALMPSWASEMTSLRPRSPRPISFDRPIEAGLHPLVDVLAQPRGPSAALRAGLALGDATHTHDPDQLVNRAGRDILDVGILDDGGQGLLGQRFQRREEKVFCRLQLPDCLNDVDKRRYKGGRSSAEQSIFKFGKARPFDREQHKQPCASADRAEHVMAINSSVTIGDEVTWIGSTDSDSWTIWRVERKLHLLGIEHVELQNRAFGYKKVIATQALVGTYGATLVAPCK